MGVSFFDLGINPALVHTLAQQGITEPFEVQREAIPDAMLGHDICCRAPTGSGKTLAFGLPLVSRTEVAKIELPTSLILTPTRELAEQITKVIKPLAEAFDLEVISVYGGIPYKVQRRALSSGVDIVVACPGRLIDLLEHDALSLEHTQTVVIDEADRMADMGFMEPVCKILDQCAKDRQTILFSATLDDEVAELVEKYQNNPVTIEVGPKEVSMETMEHFFWLMKSEMKSNITAEAIRKCGRTIVFCRTRLGVERVGSELEDEGVGVATLHGGMDQRQRNRAMRDFVGGECLALIATDVAARGIDVEGINCVVHYDPAENGKAYKHRSGRTARAGATGTVISIVQHPQKKLCSRIQREAGIKIAFRPPDFKILPNYEVKHVPAPRKKSGSGRGGGRRGGGNRPYNKKFGNQNRNYRGRNSGGGGGGGGRNRGRSGGGKPSDRKDGGSRHDRNPHGGGNKGSKAGRKGGGGRSNYSRRHRN
ncbi:MAG: RNA helicase [Methanobacteriota archaeon]|nr:MAG: RNA helicase [Euryarchaeota archaeon]HIG19553.1 DEAD/DEAH box helicase [Candidatus Poseidoniales archaeon]